MNAYAVDVVQEHNKVLILGESLSEDAEEAMSRAMIVPWRSIGWFHNRLIVKDFKVIIEITSPTSAKTMIISKVDLNAPLPQSLINYLIQNLAGIILYLLQQQVIKVKSNPDCKHAVRIRAVSTFYRDWVIPKFRLLCSSKGWDFQMNTYMFYVSDPSTVDEDITW